MIFCNTGCTQGFQLLFRRLLLKLLSCRYVCTRGEPLAEHPVFAWLWQQLCSIRVPISTFPQDICW
jgi:hypothetical protein